MPQIRYCICCGSRSDETRFPPQRIYSLPELCLDCALEWATNIVRTPQLLEFAPSAEVSD